MNGGAGKMADAPPRRYVAGSHSDYYLLLDERSDQIFAARLTEHIDAAHENNGLVAGSLPEIWMDHHGRRVWYVFGGSGGQAGVTKCGSRPSSHDIYGGLS